MEEGTPTPTSTPTTSLTPRPPMEQLRTIPLLNGIVDVGIVFGVDETCCSELLVIEEGDRGLNVDFDAIFQRELKLNFLQVITPGLVYPERSTRVVSADTGLGKDSLSDDGSFPPPPPGGKKKKKFKVEDYCLNWETIENMHLFIYPEDKSRGAATPTSSIPPSSDTPSMYGSAEDLAASIIPMLFTNILGERSFASGLRFTRPFTITRTVGSCHYTLTPWSPLATHPSDYRKVFLPTCLVFVSKLPCLRFMKEALSGLHTHLVDNANTGRDFWEVIREGCEQVFIIPAPPPGSLAVEFQLPGFQSTLTVRPPRGGVPGSSSNATSKLDDYLDIRFNYPFMCLDVDNVLQVISALLTGQTVLFTSSFYPLLTYVIQSFLTYISPFVWRHAVIPILPYPLLEILDAPVATIIGIHASLTSEVEFERVENSVIVDLDSNVVTVKLDDGPLPSLPKAAVENFKLKYSMLQRKTYEIDSIHHLSPISAVLKQKQREDFERILDDTLARMFLELMVRLFSKVIKELIRSRIKYEEAVRAMDKEDQVFYRQTESTDMFTAFYQSQRQGTQSDFNLMSIRIEREDRRFLQSDVEESYHYRPRSSIIMSGSLAFSSMGRKFSKELTSPMAMGSQDEGSIHRTSPLSMMGYASATTADMVTLELPGLGEWSNGRGEVLDQIIATLDKLQSKHSSVEAQCVLLRGYYLLCKRQFVKAFDDFYDTLQRLEVTLVPKHKSLELLSNFLSRGEKEDLEENSHYRSIISNRRKTLTSQSVVYLDRTMPKKALNHTDFIKIVRQNSIALDAESASNLHIILSQERTTVISPEAFKAFYQAWKVVLEENERVELPGIELGKAEKGVRIAERVLAVAHYVRTNFGSQSTLVLTTYRLFAVTGFSTHVMAEFYVPVRFYKFNYPASFVGAKHPGIRVDLLENKRKTDRKTKTQDIYMAFQDYLDRENWYHMLVEMLSGWGLSKRLKDSCVMETAQGHVILLNAIVQSGLMDSFNYGQRKKKILKLLSFQSKDVSEVNPITVESLQYRINPSLHETDRQTVESLLYIPPSMDDEGGNGKLWIGLGNGRLKVYDIESKCFESDIKITESKYGRSVRLSCLLLVNQHVWVGSFSKNIHILDAETVCHVSQLSFLEDAPRDMTLSQDRRVVWSLLLNGVLLAWDPVTRKRISKMQVPISNGTQFTTCTCFTIWRDHIWVGTNRGSISVMDSQSGAKITEIEFPMGTRRQVEIKHLAISSEDEVWCSVYSIPRDPDSAFIAVFNPQTHEKLMQYSKLDNRVSIILPVHNSMWCGTKSGKIYIFHAKTYASGEGMPKILSAHEDFIRTMTLTDINLVVSGSGSNDGYAAVWKTIELQD